jgi:hypothetical protein
MNTRSGEQESRLGPLVEPLESKLRPPWARPGVVPRTKLVEQLLNSQATPFVCVVAPAGYGKTTVLAQWAARKGDRVAWVSVDRRDNDPVVLLSYVAVALDRVEPIDPGVFQALASAGVSVLGTVLPRFASAVSAMAAPVALVLDHLELLDNRECLDAVAELAVRLPAGSQLVLASRRMPPGRCRCQAGRRGPDGGAPSDRGVAGRAVPGRARRQGRRRAAGRVQPHRGRPVHGRLPAVGAAGASPAGAGGVPDPHGGAGAPFGAAV